MSSYLELCQQVNTLSGMQGTFSSVSASGYQGTIAAIVSAAWEDIQNLRHDWIFLQGTQTFNTVVGQTEYEVLGINGIFSSSASSPVGSWRALLDSDNDKLRNITYDSYILDSVADDNNSEPSKYAIHPTTQSLWLNPPDAVETLTAYYWKKPQVLSDDSAGNSAVPLCPPEFHKAIVYQALIDYGVFLGSADMFQGYQTKASSLIGDLLRSQNPAKRIITPGLV